MSRRDGAVDGLGARGVPGLAADRAYRQGTIRPARYRGRAGQPKATQEAEYARLTRTGSLELAELELAALE